MHEVEKVYCIVSAAPPKMASVSWLHLADLESLTVFNVFKFHLQSAPRDRCSRRLTTGHEPTAALRSGPLLITRAAHTWRSCRNAARAAERLGPLRGRAAAARALRTARSRAASPREWCARDRRSCVAPDAARPTRDRRCRSRWPPGASAPPRARGYAPTRTCRAQFEWSLRSDRFFPERLIVTEYTIVCSKTLKLSWTRGKRNWSRWGSMDCTV